MKLKTWKPGPLPHAHPDRARNWFLALASVLAPPYVRLALNVRSVSIKGAEALALLYREAGEGRSRFLVAFRHPGDADPHLVFWALHSLLGRQLRRSKADMDPASTGGRFGGRFLSGSEILLWGGPLVRWALRNAGTVPVTHGRQDRATLDAVVNAIVESPLPVVLAPEGQVTYHTGTVQALDAGAPRLALWASDRLAASGNPLPVRIVPLAVDYAYGEEARSRLPRFLSRLERRCGLPESPALTAHERLGCIGNRLVETAERFYQATYGQAPAPEGSSLRERILRLVEGALAREEAFYGLAPSADFRTRVMTARAGTMERVFRPARDWESMSPLEREMARRAAGEAFYLDRHQQLADLAEYLDPAYAEADGPFDRLVEAAQNLWDLANRLAGGDIGDRSRTFPKDVVLTVGGSVTVERRPGEKTKEASARVLSELRREFETLAAGGAVRASLLGLRPRSSGG